MKTVISLTKLEKNLGLKLKHNLFILGLDTASTTGICKLAINSKQVVIETSIMKIPVLPKDDSDKSEKYEEALNALLLIVRDFKKTISLNINSALILEQSFLKFFGGRICNAHVFGYLRAFSGILYSELYDYFANIKFIYPSAARKLIKFKSKLEKGEDSKKKKQEIIDWINGVTGLKLEDDNEADAVLIALGGAII